MPASQVWEVLESLRPRPQVLSLDPHTLGDVWDCLRRLGEATDRVAEASALVRRLEERVSAVAERVRGASPRPRTVCLEWLSPPLYAGHWVPEMVALAGGEDLLGRPGEPGRKVPWERVVEARPQVLVAMPCGFGPRRALEELARLRVRPGWEDLPAVREGRVYAVDAHNHFSRPGPRLVEGLEVLARILHPEAFGGGPPPGLALRADLPPLPSRPEEVKG